MARIRHVDPDAPLDVVLGTIESDGAVIIDELLSRDEVARLNAELQPYVDHEPAGSRSRAAHHRMFHGANTKRVCGLCEKSDAFVDVMLNRHLLAYADHFLKPNADEYWLTTSQLMYVGPGEPAQFLHRDEANWPHFPWPGFEVTVSSMWALSPFTAENGATVVAPGSHRWADGMRIATPDELTQAEMVEGSALFYTGKAIHGAGENRSSQWRRGMHVSFVLAWLRPEENHYLAVSEARARQLPTRAQQLLGYTTYHPARGGRLGLVDFQEVLPT